MSVILDLTLPCDEFEFGRMLALDAGSEIVLETMVPIRKRSVPTFRLLSDDPGSFEERVRAHPASKDIQMIDSRRDETVYALDWEAKADPFFEVIESMEATLLSGSGTAECWQFELRFPSHKKVSEFQARCDEMGIYYTIGQIYNPTKPDAGPWYGLTPSQREALILAVEEGYYSIPREISTDELAGKLGISDQAVSERLRRGVGTMVSNTLLISKAPA